MKHLGFLTLLLIVAVGTSVAMQARDQCTVDNNLVRSGPIRYTEFHQGLSIITFGCGYPFVDLVVKDQGITHDKNAQGAAQTHWTYRFEDRDYSATTPFYEFLITKMDDPSHVMDGPKIFAEMDTLRSGDRLTRNSSWQLVSDKTGPWGGVSWLTARTVVYTLPAHQEGYLPPDPNAGGRQFPRWLAPQFMTFRQIVDMRHNVLYVLYTRGVNDGLDWMNSLRVAP